MNEHETNSPAPRAGRPAWVNWGALLLLVVLAWGAAFAWRHGGDGVTGDTSKTGNDGHAVLEGWVDGLDAGQAEAAETGRPMLVMFTASWCGPCQQLKREVLTRPDVDAALKDRFVPVIVDLSDNSDSNPNMAVAQRYGVRGIPTLIAMTPDAEPTGRVPGQATASVDAFLAWLDQAAPKQAAAR